MTTTPSPARSLVRDVLGRNRLPAEAAAYRVLCPTGGRPKRLLGPDKQPMQFPLDYMLPDFEDVLLPGDYRLDVVDASGKSLEVQIPITIPGLRNAHDVAAEVNGDDASLPTTDNEMRLVLEANVRAMQLAFVHNQRTLEMGLHMAETLRDGVHVLCDSQASWIKSISSARGFFRNAPAIQLPPGPASDDDDGEDETPEVVETSDAESKPEQPAVLQGLSAMGLDLGKLDANTIIANVVTQLIGKIDVGKIDLGSLIDWRKARKPAESSASESRKLDAPAPSAPTVTSETLFKLAAVEQALEPKERELARAIAAELEPDDRARWIVELAKLELPDAVAKVRAILADFAKPAAGAKPGA
jgi:hypothetical protein